MTTPERFPEVQTPPEQGGPKLEVTPSQEASVGVASAKSSSSQPAPIIGGTIKEVQAPMPPKPAVTNIPADNQSELEELSKGNVDEASTWFGVFWLRRVKQAVLDGIHVIFKK